MHKFYRSVLLTGMVAVGLAGCGDDVTVVDPPAPPPPPAPTVKSISVTPDGTTLAVGATRTFSAAVVADTGVATTVTWSSSDAAVASINATSGVATGVAAGSVGIKATSTVNPAVQGNATLTVQAAATPTVTGVTVTPPSASLVVGQTVQASANVQGTNNPSQTVTWSSLSPAIASVNTTTGLVTALSNGTAVIKATSSANANFSGTMSVTVTTPTPATVSLQALTTGNLATPVNLNNVAGQIEASVNVDNGDQILSRVDVLIGGVVVASQSFGVTPAAGDDAPAAAQQTIVLSFNTNQLRKVAGLFVPVVFNGQKSVTANLYVVGNSTPFASNAIQVVMNNVDAAIAPSVLATAAGAASFTNVAGTWYKSGLTTEITYLAYSTIMPTTGGAIVTLDAGCGTVGHTVAGTPTTGIVFTRTWSCAATEGARNVTGITAGVYPAGSVGPDGSVITPATVLSTTGAAYTVAGESRWNLITPIPSALPGPVRVDNLGPAIAVGAVAYNTSYDQQWVNASYAFGPRFTPTDGGSGVAAGTLTVYEFTGTCTASPAVVTGADFPETLTSDLADSKRVCARASDNLANASTSGSSNNFGVDKVNPTSQLYFMTGNAVDQVGINIMPGVSATANTSKYQIAGALANQPWAIEAQDTRSGFNQFVIVGDDAAHQSLTRLAPGVSTVGGAPTSACTLSDQLTTTLSNSWKRSMLPSTTLDCGQGVGYYWYTGNVNDRAGNFSTTIARNFVFDPGTPNITGLGFDVAGYTSGSAATFSVAANDDLSVMTGTITFLHNGMKNPWVGIQYPHGSLNSLGTPWATMHSQLTHILNGGALTVPNLLTRIDESCEFNADPYASCDVTTNGAGSKPTAGADYNANLFAGGTLNDSTKAPATMITNVADFVGREAGASLVTPILLTQYNGHNTATFNNQPWSAADIATWTVTRTVSVVTAVHKTISSNGLTFFDDASLWRLNTATNVWVFCSMMTTPAVPTIDNGSFRTWSYTAAVPGAGTACGALTGTYKVMGRKAGAGLFTVAIP